MQSFDRQDSVIANNKIKYYRKISIEIDGKQLSELIYALEFSRMMEARQLGSLCTKHTLDQLRDLFLKEYGKPFMLPLEL